jgi:hypothetical protein
MLNYTQTEWTNIIYRLVIDGALSGTTLDDWFEETYRASVFRAALPERWITLRFDDLKYQTLFILKYH